MVAVAPYWNVNKGKGKTTIIEGIVAVAPYWNVNTCISGADGLGIEGSSSTILECKLDQLAEELKRRG